MDSKNIAIGVLVASTIALGGAAVIPEQEPTPVILAGAGTQTEIIKEVVYQEKVIPTKTVQFKPYDVNIRFRKDDSSLTIGLLAEDGTNATIEVRGEDLDRVSVSDKTKTVRQLVNDFVLKVAEEPTQ